MAASNQNTGSSAEQGGYADKLRQAQTLGRAGLSQAQGLAAPIYKQNKAGDLARAASRGAQFFGQEKMSNALTEIGNIAEKEDIKENDQKISRDEKEQEWMRKLNIAARAARAGEVGARFLGQGKIADVLGEFGDVAEGGEAAADSSQAGMARKTGSNFVGSKAGMLAQAKGLGGAKAAGLGDAVSGALQGEGAVGMAQTAFSWAALKVAFKFLFTLVGSIPALLYLNFHFVMSKFKSKTFREMFFWQKMVLLFADIIIFVVILGLLFLTFMLTNPCAMLEFMGTWWSKLFAGVCGAVSGQ